MAAGVLSFLGKAGKRLAGWRLQDLTPLQVMQQIGLGDLLRDALKDQLLS